MAIGRRLRMAAEKGGIVGVVAMIFIAANILLALFSIVPPILMTCWGVLCGWVVGLVYGETILGIAAQLGVRGVEMWQIGAFLGFVSGFLRTDFSRDWEDER